MFGETVCGKGGCALGGSRGGQWEGNGGFSVVTRDEGIRREGGSMTNTLIGLYRC